MSDEIQKTHHAECWRDHRHHGCAVGRIDALHEAARNLIRHVERNECTHEEVHRGGQWTICDGCKREWPDDRGGFEPYKEPKELVALRDLLDTLHGEPEEYAAMLRAEMQMKRDRLDTAIAQWERACIELAGLKK